MNKSPCLNCKERDLNCHGSCIKYHKFRKALDKAKESKTANSDYQNYLYNSRKRTMR